MRGREGMRSRYVVYLAVQLVHGVHDVSHTGSVVATVRSRENRGEREEGGVRE